MNKKIAGLFLILGAFIGAYSTVPAFADTINSLPQYIISKDEGVQLTARTTSLNFVGAGVTATNSGNAVTVTVPGGGSSIDLLVNGIPNIDQTTLNLVQGSNITLTDFGSGIVQIDAVTGAGGNNNSIQYNNGGVIGGINSTYYDIFTDGSYYNTGTLWVTTDINDRSKSGTFDANLLSGTRTYQIPDNDGILTLSVNGTTPDSSGNITIPIGTGTVTSVDASGGTTGLSFSGGAITTSGVLTLGGTLITSNGGTGLSSWTQGDIPYFNSGTSLSKLAKNTSATRYLSNTGTSNNPAWAQIDLTNGVTGALPVANGGTGLTTFGGTNTILYTTSANNLASSTNFLYDGSKMTVTQPVATSGSPTGLLFTGGAHTTLTASTEAIDVNFNFARTVQFATGALTTQRSMYIQGATYGFVGASTLTNAYTLQVDAPTAGTNATITNALALFVNGNWKWGSGVTGMYFRPNTSDGANSTIYSTNVTPSNTNHSFMTNGVTTRLNGTSAGAVILTIDGTSRINIGSALIANSVSTTVTDTVAGTVLDVTNSTTSAAANGLRVNMANAGFNAAQGLLVLNSTTATASTIQNFINIQKNNINADTTQEHNISYSLRDNSSSRQAAQLSMKYSNTGSGTQVTDFIWRTLQGGTTLTDAMRLSGQRLFVGGSTTPTAWLHLAAGTATANTAPLKFTSGTLNTTAVAGQIEYNNSFYETNNAGVRMGMGGTIADYFTDATVGGAEADIYTITTPANTFATNGEKVEGYYAGNFVTVGTELTQLKVYFAGTAIWDSTGVAPTMGTTSWNVEVKLIRVSSTVIRYSVTLSTTGASGFVYSTSGELTGLTLSGTNILKITGTSTGVGSGSGDIVGKSGSLEWKASASL